MNKKIKVIDLIDKKYHNLELPKHIRINKLEYFYNENRKTYDSEYGEQMSFDFTDSVLNMEVEILEDNTEEIEETNLCYVTCESDFKNMNIVKLLNEFFEKNDLIVNELARAVNQIRKEKE